MSHNWLLEALLCILMPACLFDTNSLSHTQTRIRAVWHIKPWPKQIALRMCFCPFYQSSAAKVNQSWPPSQLITVLSCHIIQQCWVGELQRRLLCWTLRRTALLWAVRYYPANDLLILPRCRHAADVSHWQRHISANHRQTNQWKQTPPDREQGEEDLLILLNNLIHFLRQQTN